MLRTQNIELDKEQEKKLQLERQEYRKDLKQQIEYNRQKLVSLNLNDNNYLGR